MPLLDMDDSFGWFHPSWGDVGVLLCPGVGRDARGGYAPLRVLAEALAARGYPGLRLEYPGTGDADDLTDQDPVEAWRASVHRAADRLRQRGVRQLVFCGIRLGGLLAGVTSGERDDVAALILIDPVVSGRRYLRELSVEGAFASEVPGSDEAWPELDGSRLPEGPHSFLHRLSLLKLDSRPAARALLLTEPGAPIAALEERLHGLGTDVGTGPLDPLLETDQTGRARPMSDLTRIVDWLAATLPVLATPRPCPAAAPMAGWTTPELSEQGLRYGSDQSRFGVLCRPRHDALPGFVLMIGNGGAVPHHGYAGFGVRLARTLARAGFASFRFDYAGLGDSGNAPGDAYPHVFETDRTGDAALTIEALRGSGFTRFAAGGLCSGAYHAWRAGLADERIEAVIMLNPSTFFWREGQDYAQFIRNNTRSTQFYVATMMGGRGWRRLLRGELNVGRAVRTVRTHALRRAAAVAAQAAELVGWQARDSPRRAMRQLSGRGVQTLLVMGTIDAGLDVLQAYFGPGGRWLARLPNTKLAIMPGADHSLTRRGMQDAVAGVVAAFLRERLLTQASAPSAGVSSHG